MAKHNSAIFEKGVIVLSKERFLLSAEQCGMGPWDNGTRRDLGGGAQDSDQRCNFVYIHRAQ